MDPAPTTTVDLGMRLVIKVPDYKHAGMVMDAMGDALAKVLEDAAVPGRWDFTHVNTRPCKAARMEALAFDSMQSVPVMGAADPTPDDF